MSLDARRKQAVEKLIADGVPPQEAIRRMENCTKQRIYQILSGVKREPSERIRQATQCDCMITLRTSEALRQDMRVAAAKAGLSMNNWLERIVLEKLEAHA